jgi:hypothetical protein
MLRVATRSTTAPSKSDWPTIVSASAWCRSSSPPNSRLVTSFVVLSAATATIGISDDPAGNHHRPGRLHERFAAQARAGHRPAPVRPCRNRTCITGRMGRRQTGWYINVLQEAGKGILTNGEYWNRTINSPVAVLPIVEVAPRCATWISPCISSNTKTPWRLKSPISTHLD